MARIGRPPEDPRIRFQRFVVEAIDGCWHWSGSILVSRGGHGQFQIDGHPEKAHRVAWKFANGEIPDGLMVLHRCNVACCVNPAHLYLGVHKDNVADAMAAGSYLKGIENPGASLGITQLIAIRELRARGLGCKRIAAVVGSTKSTVHNVVTGKHYREAA